MSPSQHTYKLTILSLLILILHISLSVQDNPFAANYHDDEDDIGQVIIDPNHIDAVTFTDTEPTATFDLDQLPPFYNL
jgi:hypothetical protein